MRSLVKRNPKRIQIMPLTLAWGRRSLRLLSPSYLRRRKGEQVCCCCSLPSTKRTKNHGSKKLTRSRHIARSLSRFTMNERKAQTTQTFSFPIFIRSCVSSFLAVEKGQVVSSFSVWLGFSVGNPKTTKFSQWSLPSSRKQNIREKSLITVPVYSGRNAIPFPSSSFSFFLRRRELGDRPINQSHRKEEAFFFFFFFFSLFCVWFLFVLLLACDGCIRNPSYRRGMQAHPEKVVEIEGEAFYNGVDNVNDKDDSDRVWSVRSTWPTLYISCSRERKTWCSPKSGRMTLKLQKKIYIYIV